MSKHSKRSRHLGINAAKNTIEWAYGSSRLLNSLHRVQLQGKEPDYSKAGVKRAIASFEAETRLRKVNLFRARFGGKFLPLNAATLSRMKQANKQQGGKK